MCYLDRVGVRVLCVEGRCSRVVWMGRCSCVVWMGRCSCVVRRG